MQVARDLWPLLLNCVLDLRVPGIKVKELERSRLLCLLLEEHVHKEDFLVLTDEFLPVRLKLVSFLLDMALYLVDRVFKDLRKLVLYLLGVLLDAVELALDSFEVLYNNFFLLLQRDVFLASSVDRRLVNILNFIQVVSILALGVLDAVYDALRAVRHAAARAKVFIWFLVVLTVLEVIWPLIDLDFVVLREESILALVEGGVAVLAEEGIVIQAEVYCLVLAVAILILALLDGLLGVLEVDANLGRRLVHELRLVEIKYQVLVLVGSVLLPFVILEAH